MVTPIPQAKIDRAKILLTVHDIATVASILGCSPDAVSEMRKRGFKEGRPGRRPRARPGDFAIQCQHMTITDLCAHYRATFNTVKTWMAGIERPSVRRKVDQRKPIPADFVETLDRLGPKATAAHYGVHDLTAIRWREQLGLPVKRRRRAERPALPSYCFNQGA